MGYYWQTIIFFLLHKEWPTSLVEDVLARLAEIEIVFQRIGNWYGPNGDLVERPSLREAVDLCTRHKGGLLDMGYYIGENELEMAFGLTFSFCGQPYISLNNAEGAFGSIKLSAHSYYITTGSAKNIMTKETDYNFHDDTKRHLGLIYTASRILAETSGAIYGLGDHDYDLEHDNAVPTRSLQNWEIPRLAWWSFYSNEYCERLGVHRLDAASTWLKYRINNGLIIIAHPPTEPDRWGKKPRY